MAKRLRVPVWQNETDCANDYIGNARIGHRNSVCLKPLAVSTLSWK